MGETKSYFASSDTRIGKVICTKQEKSEDNCVDKTLAWVRANAVERRVHYHRRRRARGHDESSKQHHTLIENIVDESIARGRAVLADAEAHLNLFEECIAEQCINNPDDIGDLNHEIDKQSYGDEENCDSSSVYLLNNDEEGLQKSRDQSAPLAEISLASVVSHDRVFNCIDATDFDPSLNLGACERLEKISNRKMPLNFNRKIGSKQGEEVVVKEGKPEIICLDGRCGITDYTDGEDQQKVDASKDDSSKWFQVKGQKDKAKSVSFVDDSRQVAPREFYSPIKRKKTTIDKKVASESEKTRGNNFKARPLPGGKLVKNDIHAPTKAVLGKMRMPTDAQADTSTKKPSIAPKSRKHLSLVGELKCIKRLGVQYNSDGDDPADLKSIDVEIESLDDSDGGSSDVAYIEKQILKLQDELGRKRLTSKHLKKMIKESEDITLNTLDYTKEVCTHENATINERTISLLDNKQHLTSESLSNDHCLYSNFYNDTSDRNSALFRRLEKWTIEKERKRIEARLQKDKSAMEFTGIPRLSETADSWEKAKVAHALAIQAAYEEDKRRLEGKKTSHCIHQQELQELTNTCSVMVIKRSPAANVLALDKLSRPKVTKEVRQKKHPREGTIPVKQVVEQCDKNTKSALSPDDLVTQSVGQDEKGVKPIISSEGRYEEMDDNQFSNIMKALGINFHGVNSSNEKGRRSKKKLSKTSIRNKKQNSKHVKTETEYKDIYNNVTMLEDHNLVGKTDLDNKLSFAKCSQSNDEMCSSHVAEHEYCLANASCALELASLKIDEPHEITKTVTLSSSIIEENIISNLTERVDHFEKGREDFQQPYQKYEEGKVNFFDRSSSSEKGRFRVRDAKGFSPETIRRKPDTESGENGVMLLVGRESDNTHLCDVAITIVFDRSKFTEKSASEWWWSQRHRFIEKKSSETTG